jgi:hypothetical protein
VLTRPEPALSNAWRPGSKFRRCRVAVDVSGEEYIDYEKEVLAYLMRD